MSTQQAAGTRYRKAFFDLQLVFATRVAEVSGLPTPRALLEYTNLYVRFGLGRDFNPSNPVWLAFLDGIEGAGDLGEWTYRFYLQRAGTPAGPRVAASFGCFSYGPAGENRIRLHFQNRDAAGSSSLGADCAAQRRAELAALFAHVRQSLHEQVRVTGVSWLYNLAAYRRLFPASYVATPRVLIDRFQTMPLWGQFLDRHGRIKAHLAGPFVDRLRHLTSVERLHECFPLQVLSVEAPVRTFYDYYAIPSRAASSAAGHASRCRPRSNS